MSDFGQRGTLRKHKEPEPTHWAWPLVGGSLALILLSMAGAYLAEKLI